MTDCVRTLCVLSLFSGVLISLTPEGGAQRVLRVLSSAVLLAVIFDSIGKLDRSQWPLELARYQALERTMLSDGEKVRDELNRLVIEQEYREYIEGRAKEIGISLRSLQIGLRWSTDGLWVPDSARVGLRFTHDREALRQILWTELGIPDERQEWEIPDEWEGTSEEA